MNDILGRTWVCTSITLNNTLGFKGVILYMNMHIIHTFHKTLKLAAKKHPKQKESFSMSGGIFVLGEYFPKGNLSCGI